MMCDSAVGAAGGKLVDQKIVVYGAGTAGMGVADQSESDTTPEDDGGCLC